ncbi:10328_t:CDS:1, partial [Ambispora gerdemannii]
MSMMWWNVIDDNYPHLQIVAKMIFSITSSQASCEQNFSILKWFCKDNRTRLNTLKLEAMAKIHS